MNFPPVIFFDLDDTIISFSGEAIPLWQELCENYCQRTGNFQAQQLFQAIREASRWYWSDKDRHRTGRLDLFKARRETVETAFRKLGDNNIKDAYRIADDYSSQRNDRLRTFPGAVETLKQLKAQGLRLALITNGDSAGQNYKIKKFALRQYFERIFIEGEVGVGKPDIRAYENALETMDITPQEAWMVGDNLEWDVAAPQTLGIYSIWNDYRKQGLPESSDVVPDKIIHHISELLPSDLSS